MQRILSKSQKIGSKIRPFVLGLVFIGALGFAACSDLRDDPDSPNGPVAPIHPEGWVDRAAKENFHGEAIRSNGWDMSACQSCHGVDYAGGIAESSCLKCHSRTPASCNTCHGTGNHSAPPEDAHGNMETDAIGVGAHQTHDSESATALVFGCTECHYRPQDFADPAHIDGDGRAEITWHELAQTGGLAPQYDGETGTCADTYCHSGGRFGNNPTMVWTEVGSGQADCGTCHGLPPTGVASDGKTHLEVEASSCSNCHARVVDENNNIVDKMLHINGTTDF